MPSVAQEDESKIITDEKATKAISREALVLMVQCGHADLARALRKINPTAIAAEVPDSKRGIRKMVFLGFPKDTKAEVERVSWTTEQIRLTTPRRVASAETYERYYAHEVNSEYHYTIDLNERLFSSDDGRVLKSEGLIIASTHPFLYLGPREKKENREESTTYPAASILRLGVQEQVDAIAQSKPFMNGETEIKIKNGIFVAFSPELSASLGKMLGVGGVNDWLMVSDVQSAPREKV